jgi:hypothetical protein
VSAVANAVTRITSVAGWWARTSRNRPRPSSAPGIRRSVTTTSTGRAASAVTAAAPLSASWTSCPARRRQIARKSRIEASSSTTSTRPMARW